MRNTESNFSKAVTFLFWKCKYFVWVFSFLLLSRSFVVSLHFPTLFTVTSWAKTSGIVGMKDQFLRQEVSTERPLPWLEEPKVYNYFVKMPSIQTHLEKYFENKQWWKEIMYNNCSQILFRLLPTCCLKRFHCKSWTFVTKMLFLFW